MNIETLAAKIEALEKKVNEQDKELVRVRDIEAIKKLQRAYGYYVERWMYQELVDCYSDRDDVTMDYPEGKFKGKEGIIRYFGSITDQPREFLHQLMPIAGIVDVDPDGLTASGRWYAFGGVFTPMGEKMRRVFVNGLYEMRYIKDDGVWKILELKWTIPYVLNIPEGWAIPEMINAGTLQGKWGGPAPDIATDPADLRYISGTIFPLHFTHPVTGKPTSENELNRTMLERTKQE